MSIYATLWALKFPVEGQYHTHCEWVTVIAQGVPAHIGEDDDAHYAFLPPREHSISDALRAVVFVRELAEKGTERSSQEYCNPLLTLSGKEYSSIPFPILQGRISDALRSGRPRIVAEIHTPDGKMRIQYEDGSFLDLVDSNDR